MSEIRNISLTYPFGENYFITKNGFGCGVKHLHTNDFHICIPKFSSVPVQRGDELVKILTGAGYFIVKTKLGNKIKFHTDIFDLKNDYDFVRFIELQHNDIIIDVSYCSSIYFKNIKEEKYEKQ